MNNNNLVIGITGVTCGGKTTLSKKLMGQISQVAKHSKFKINVKVISQDDYFLDVADRRHIWIEEIQHIHFDIITSLDMEKMYRDILQIICNKPVKREKKPFPEERLIHTEEEHVIYHNFDLMSFIEGLVSDISILILEGFSIYQHKEIYELCNLRYFFTLDYEECRRRRLLRVYEPPDCEGYFEMCVWPEYQKYFKLVKAKSEPGGKFGVTFFESDEVDISMQVVKDIIQHFNVKSV